MRQLTMVLAACILALVAVVLPPSATPVHALGCGTYYLEHADYHAVNVWDRNHNQYTNVNFNMYTFWDGPQDVYGNCGDRYFQTQVSVSDGTPVNVSLQMDVMYPCGATSCWWYYGGAYHSNTSNVSVASSAYHYGTATRLAENQADYPSGGYWVCCHPTYVNPLIAGDGYPYFTTAGGTYLYVITDDLDGKADSDWPQETYNNAYATG